MDAANISTQTGTPKPPTEFKAMPSDLNYLDPKDSNYCGKFLTEYDVEGLDAPPLDNVSLTRTFTLASDDKNFDRGIELSVPEGYEAVRAYTNLTYNYTKSDFVGMTVFVGDIEFAWNG